MKDDRHHVVIIGGGFAGLQAAQRLKRVSVRITLIDRKNHHLFQPLLYQVATAGLSPGDIAEPIRNILRKQKNVTVLLDEVRAIDPVRKTLTMAHGDLTSDSLVLATGVRHNYFGNDAWEPLAPGLKTLEDAVTIRQRFLMAFEEAERCPEREDRARFLTFVIIGGGPTGVELAGTMAEMARKSLPRDFRGFDGADTRIVLLEGGPRVLSAYPEDLSASALEQLQAKGVEVRTGALVTHIDPEAVHIGDERIATRNVFWAAGVQGNALGATLGVPLDRFGRVKVNPDLTIPGHPEVFVLGDLAHLIDAAGVEVPGVAQGAIQMGRHAALTIESRVERRVLPPPFVYNNKGMLATIGRSAAIGVVGPMKLRGFVAWVMWLFIHLVFLVGFDNQVMVLIQWFWSYVNYKQGARLITERYSSHADPRALQAQGD